MHAIWNGFLRIEMTGCWLVLSPVYFELRSLTLALVRLKIYSFKCCRCAWVVSFCSSLRKVKSEAMFDISSLIQEASSALGRLQANTLTSFSLYLSARWVSAQAPRSWWQPPPSVPSRSSSLRAASRGGRARRRLSHLSGSRLASSFSPQQRTVKHPTTSDLHVVWWWWCNQTDVLGCSCLTLNCKQQVADKCF